MEDRNQAEAYSSIVYGHNVVLTGQAGTGKTFTIKQCVNKLRCDGKNVALTCYTGIACLQYQGMYPMTLHKFAGLEDGRHSNEHLLHLVHTDERFISIKKRILDTDILIIDEVSMVSKKVLETVEYLCRQLRGGGCFGGLQVVLCGDFFQLPPIKDELYGDNGNYCIQANFFKEMFTHVMHLNTVHRQTENCLIRSVNDLEKGQPSEETDEFMKLLSRPLPAYVQPAVKLFARNLDVDLYNYQSLMALNNNPLHVFVAEDSGDSFYLKKVLAPKRLGIKLSAPVMLLRNLNERHVNGLTGKVAAIESDCIHVSFETNGQTEIVKISKCSFSKYDPANNKCISCRYQYPLRLAYAITIHKSQGMTLPSVEIDCNHATSPGQIGVAVGRAETSAGLRVLNYKPSLCKKHPKEVTEFYENSQGMGVLQYNLKCCRHFMYTHDPVSPISKDFDSDSEIDEDENIDQMLHDLDTRIDHNYNKNSNCENTNVLDHNYNKIANFENTDVLNVFKEAFSDFIGTPAEQDGQIALNMLLSNKEVVTTWYLNQCCQVQHIYDLSCTADPGNLKPKHFTEFYSQFNMYISSKHYLQESEGLTVLPVAQQILTSVMFVIQANVIKCKAKSVHKPEQVLHTIFPSTEAELSAAGRGKIRYIGGYCVAKCRYRLCVALRHALFVPGMETEVEHLQAEITVLDGMTDSATDIMFSTIYEETLEETSRKQNVCEGLTNIKDVVFEFFKCMELHTRAFMTMETLENENKHMFQYVFRQLMSDTELLECFIKKCYIREDADVIDSQESIHLEDTTTVAAEVCDNLLNTCTYILTLFQEIVHLFLSVVCAQFRKDYLRHSKTEKGKALRKKVLEKRSKGNFSQAIDMKFIENDNSEGKQISHFKLKAAALESEQFYTDYKKKEIVTILKAYGKDIGMNKCKRDMGMELLHILKEDTSLRMTYPNTLSANHMPRKAAASTSVESTSVMVTASTSLQPLARKSVETHVAILVHHAAGTSMKPAPGTEPITAGLSVESTAAVISVNPAPCTSVEPTASMSVEPTAGTSVELTASMSVQRTTQCGKKRKKTITSSLSSADRLLNPHGVHTLIGKGKATKCKGKRKRVKRSASRKVDTVDDTSEDCGVCGKFYKEAEDWISCDECSLWYHRQCIGLEDEQEWIKYGNTDAVYTCPMCL